MNDDRSHYEMLLILEEPNTPNFQFRQPTETVSKFIDTAREGRELEIFVIRNAHRPYEPDWGDCQPILRGALDAKLIDLFVETHHLDDLKYCIGVLRKRRRSTLGTIKRVIRQRRLKSNWSATKAAS